MRACILHRPSSPSRGAWQLALCQCANHPHSVLCTPYFFRHHPCPPFGDTLTTLPGPRRRHRARAPGAASPATARLVRHRRLPVVMEAPSRRLATRHSPQRAHQRAMRCPSSTTRPRTRSPPRCRRLSARVPAVSSASASATRRPRPRAAATDWSAQASARPEEEGGSGDRHALRTRARSSRTTAARAREKPLPQANTLSTRTFAPCAVASAASCAATGARAASTLCVSSRPSVSTSCQRRKCGIAASARLTG